MWKLNNQGTTLWAISGGGSKDENGNGVSVDGGSNVFVVGNTDSPSGVWGGYTLTTSTQVSVLTKNCVFFTRLAARCYFIKMAPLLGLFNVVTN